MAKQDKKDRSDEVRIIGEESDEVVRLDAPKWVPVERKVADSEEKALPHMMGEGVEKVESTVVPLDPETRWLEQAESRESKVIPVGWFVLLGLTIVGIFCWVVFQAPDQDEAMNETGVRAPDGVPVGKYETQVAVEEAARHYARTKELAAAFLEADTVSEKARFVRDQERVLPLMKDYYERNPLAQHTFEEILEYHIVSLRNFPFVALNLKVEGEENIPLLVEDGPQGLKVDWESYVCYQPMSFETLLEERLVEPLDFRVYARPDHFYAYEFADESRFDCYQLTTRDSETIIFGYVERGTKLEEEFRKIFSTDSASGGAIKSPLILSLSFLPGSKASRSVKIHEIRSLLWAYPPDSFQKKTSER